MRFLTLKADVHTVVCFGNSTNGGNSCVARLLAYGLDEFEEFVRNFKRGYKFTTNVGVGDAKGGAAFFEGQKDGSPAEMEASSWINAIRTDTDPVVLPRQALCVTRILEAISESAKSGQPVYFND